MHQGVEGALEYCEKPFGSWTSVTYPFTVDGHVCTVVDIQVLHFWDIFDMFHICGITSCPKNTGNFGPRINVMGRNQSPSRIVDESG